MSRCYSCCYPASSLPLPLPLLFLAIVISFATLAATAESSNGGRDGEAPAANSNRSLLDRCRRNPTWRTVPSRSGSSSSSSSSSSNDSNSINLAEACPSATGYTPPTIDRLVAGGAPDDEYSSGRGWYDVIVSCLDDAAADLAAAADDSEGDDSSEEEEDDSSGNRRCPSNERDDNAPPIHQPQITGLYPSPQNAIMATVEFALTEEEAELVRMLSWCLRYHHPDQFERRGFDYAPPAADGGGAGDEAGTAGEDGTDEADELDEGGDETAEEGDGDNADVNANASNRGGNDVTFLAGFLQLYAPGVSSQIYTLAHMVWSSANWSNITHDGFGNAVHYPNPYHTGLRTSEHLSYARWGSLGEHVDSESVYTVLIAMADPTEYEGGEFYIKPKSLFGSDFTISLRPGRLSAIVFISEEAHGVGSIMSGRREMFTNELWAYDDVGLGVLRPRISDHLERTSSSSKQ